MKIKALASAAVIALSSFAASAASTAPVKVTGFSFSDYELGTFTLTETSDVTGTLSFEPYVSISPGIQIAFATRHPATPRGKASILSVPGVQIGLPAVSFGTVSVYNAEQELATTGTLSGGSFTFSGLDAGTYSLQTGASVRGLNFVSSQFTVSAVPEPESFAMLLAGLGLVGALARRRNKMGVV